MSKKMTRKQQAEYDAHQEARFAAWAAHRDKHHGKEQDAVLCWFDTSSGEGVVELEDGSELYAHFTAIEGIEKNRYSYPTEADQAKLKMLGRNYPVRVVPYISPGFHCCEKIKLKGAMQ